MPYPATPDQICAALAVVVLSCRKHAGLSQQQVADRGGLTQNTICDIERGSRGPAFISFLRLAYGLGMDASDLLDAVADQLALPLSDYGQ